MVNTQTDNSKSTHTWVSRKEACTITTLSKRTIDRYIKQGRILAKKMGESRVVIAKESLTPKYINSVKPKFS